MKFHIIIILLFLTFFITSCGVNIFSPFSAKDYPQANEYQAKNLIDQGRYLEILTNAEKYPAQDHVAAALGIMGFDLKLLTNLIGQTNQANNILLAWVDISDTNYVLDLTYSLSRLQKEALGDLDKSISLFMGGMASTMLGILFLADIANTNAINISDGLSEQEINVLSYWLANPPQNITNLFRYIGKDKTGKDYDIATLIGKGTSTLLFSMASIYVSLSTNQAILNDISNVFASLDEDSNGDITSDEVSNYITILLSNIITNQ
ncbi:MAG: hypothetical protein ACP5QP_05000 [Brevinematia bacterium]